MAELKTGSAELKPKGGRHPTSEIFAKIITRANKRAFEVLI